MRRWLEQGLPIHFAWSVSGGGIPRVGSPNGGELEGVKSAESGSKFGSSLGLPPVDLGANVEK